MPDYGSTASASGAATPQRLEGVSEDPESPGGTPSSEVARFESEGNGEELGLGEQLQQIIV